MDLPGNQNGHRKVITAPSLKRGKDEMTPLNEKRGGAVTCNTIMGLSQKREQPAYQVKLERVLGLTVANNAGLDSDPNSELVAYPAGCTVVLSGRGRQSHVVNASRKTITCLRFSPDGRYLATGECGHAPCLRLWDLHEGSVLAEMTGHKYSINCLAFSPTQKYIVSVGSQHDMIVNVWDWRSGLKVASNKVSTKVKAISFAENGTYFVTVGNRHVKFWYLDYHRGSKYKEPVPLMGRSAILGEQRNNDFVDVACGRGDTADSTYTITRSGLLCEFNNRRLLDKWVELRTSSANCMALGENRIFIGCAEGIVRCFDPQTLQFITTLPRTHYLGVDVAQGLDISHMASHSSNAKYPDTIAVTYDEKNSKLTCVYNDHSLYIWDVRDIKRVGKSQSYLYHSACIWGVEMFPEGGPLPPGSFITCSSDDTIRVWNVDTQIKTSPDSAYQRNIYSKELLKVVYIDPELSCLKDMELQGERGDNTAAYDGKNGVRSLRISPDGKHLASGDRAGNIRVHTISTLEELCLIEAHDAEVLCLEYSRPESGFRLLASASRDRLVHVFDVSQGYNFLQTLDDHSSSITAVRFLNNHQNLQMVSCGADKSIIFRQLQTNPDGQVQFNRTYNAAGKTTLYDMEVDVSHKHVITACQDRNIRVYNVSSGKHSKTFKGSIGEEGSLIKVTLDASGIFVATSCTDKTLCIYDYYSGECMATMSGHSELVTGLRFSPDCTRLVSASGDGCVLVWTVPHDMVVTMQARLANQQARAKKPTTKITNGLHNLVIDNDDFGSTNHDIYDPNANQADYRYSFGQLPVWAKKDLEIGEAGSGGGRTPAGPRGRWAQRVNQSPITFKSVIDDPVIISPREKRLDSDGSKEDSSVDSGAEMGRSILIKRESHIVTKVQDPSIDFMACPESLNEIMAHESKSIVGGKITLTRGHDVTELNQRPHTDDSSLGSFKYEDLESTEHDGDVEDCSEGESSDTRRPLYIPSHDEPNREFPITNMDAGELRKSMRKSKRPDLLMVTSEMSSASRSVSGSQSDDDDQTPTSDHAHHSVSSDTLDVIGHREKYLKNTFESLSGAEDSMGPVKKGKRSLSSQHHVSQSNPGVRNSNVIQAAQVAKNDAEALRKREELQRRIQETRRQLQSVGYRSSLKMSQSIQDLSLQGVYSTSGGDNRPKPTPRHRAVQQGKEIDSSTFTRKPKPTNITNNQSERPVSLNLSQLSVNPYKSGSKSMDTSLTGSPVYDKLSPTNFTDTEISMKFAAQEANRFKRYSCSFYVNINEKAIDTGRESKSYDDLNDICKNDIFLPPSNNKSDKSDGSEYSSDSLEECSGFGSKPRRCVSEYQILERSASAFGFKGSTREKTKFHSEENILADDGGENWDRHSSASFFLRKTSCRSTESILTDESEYQYLFDNKFRSTESILTDGGDLLQLSDDGLDEVPMKQTVSRTRSLQETGMREIGGGKSRPETPYSFTETDGKKNESFFIPMGDGPEKPNPPSSLLKKYQNKEEKKTHHNHPVVAHKPPKPKLNSTGSSRVKTAQKRIDKLLAEKKCGNVFRKELWEAPVKDPGLNSIPDLPAYNGGRVKLLSQNFERISAREEVSCDSGSSTPGTSSSCANSPKRKWKPSIGNQLARRIANGQLLPDKCPAVEEEGGIRRACSLSDLANPSPRARASVSAKATTKNHPNSRYTTPKSSMTRSSSVGVLNQQSDSESDISQATVGQRSLVSLRVMRPTISSQNKMSATASSKALAARRRALSGAYSAIALNQGGQTEDSSSEENQPPNQGSSKPTPPPRPKSMANLDRAGGRRAGLGRSGSERDLNRAGGTKVQRSASGMLRGSNLEPSPFELPVKDLTSAPLSEQLITTMAEQLQRAAESVVQLHSRLQTVDQEEREALLGGLTGSIGEVQKALGMVLPKQQP